MIKLPVETPTVTLRYALTPDQAGIAAIEATFEPQQLVSERLEAYPGLLDRSTESALDRAPGVGLPVAILVGPACSRAVEDCLGDLLSGVTSHGHPDSDLCVEP